jgi:hypothetical protein
MEVELIMPWEKPQTPCPFCGDGVLQRRRRNFWMRLVPGSKHYVCNMCREHYLLVYGRRMRLLPQG